MLGFIYDRHAPVPTDALYRFCRDEALNYDYIVAGMGGKPRKKGKAPLFFKRMRRGRMRRPDYRESGGAGALCPKTE